MHISVVKHHKNGYKVNGMLFLAKTAKDALSQYLSIHSSGSVMIRS